MTGTEIKELRNRLKLSQLALADILGVASLTVIRWETNQKRPSNLAERELTRLVRKVNKGGKKK
ncbi:MAG: helix-turn-helix domain-containing protein [Proteobacteria bacterium]|nr:helix-turn-helix domain-containing protein [Pseudomonadota bacterium]